MTAYVATPDTDATDPRQDWDEKERHALLIWDSGHGHYPPGYPHNPALALFYRMAWDQDHGKDAALRAANRWSRMFGDGSPVTLTTIHGYSQSDWWEILAVGHEQDSYRNELTMWLRGDIWRVTEYTHQTCSLGHEHAEELDSLGGVYAPDEETAIAYYLNEI